MLSDDLEVTFTCPGCGAAINSSLGHLRASQEIRCTRCRGAIEIQKSPVRRTVDSLSRGLREAEQAWRDLLRRTAPQTDRVAPLDLCRLNAVTSLRDFRKTSGS